MDLGRVLEHIYLPLLTQETAVMIASFTYGLKEGLSPPALVATDSAAILTDLAVFFAPAYILAGRLHGSLERHFAQDYDRTVRLVRRWGTFRAATVMGFVMPSVTSMLTAGLLRLPFWRALAGLLVGSGLYIAIPLLLALPLAASLPPIAVVILPWAGPILAAMAVLAYLLRARRPRLRR